MTRPKPNGEDRSSSLRIVGETKYRVELTATFDGKFERFWVEKANPGSRGQIALVDEAGNRVGDLGMMRERYQPFDQCPHHKRLVKMLFG